MSKYGVISGPYVPVFGLNTEIYEVNLLLNPNTGKYRPEITPYLDIFHAVNVPNNAFETSEWYIVGLTAILRLLRRKKSPFFFKGSTLLQNYFLPLCSP